MFSRLAAFVLLLSIVRVSADTFVVTNVLESGPGSLRQAITEANAHPNSAGPDRIHFDIPGPGVHTIVLASTLPDITESAFVDGWSQPGFQTKPLIELTTMPGGAGDGLRLLSNFITVRGLILNRFETGIAIGPYAWAAVQGCYVGTDETGTLAAPNRDGIVISGGSQNLIGGSGLGAGNVISGNTGIGILLQHQLGSGQPDIVPEFNIIQGNFIGTDVTGSAAVPNEYGIYSSSSGNFGGVSARGHRIGGTISSARNVISGNRADGIKIDRGSEMRIQGNLIGIGADGVTPLGNEGSGIQLVEVVASIIGAEAGANLDAANKIGHNGGANIPFGGRGIVSLNGSSSPLRNRVSANSIHDNVQLGLDLSGDGVTSNDADHVNFGRQNFPVISDAFGSNGQLTIYGNLNSIASTNFTLEFFANQAADSSGFGEGQTFLGQANVTTDGAGNAIFNVTFPLPANVAVVTATAIRPDNSTSEFSAAVNIVASTPTAPPTGPTAVALPTRADQLLNLSTRVRVGTGDEAMIGGFIILGTQPKKIIVRGLGPSLSGFNVPDFLADPNLTLTRTDVLFNDPRAFVGSNDNWKSDQQGEIENSGLAPANDVEAALVRTLEPGFYTAVMRGNGGGTGVALLEVYDLSTNSNSVLANISTRGFVGTGDNVMIAGVIVGGNGKGGATVVIRGIGPSLSSFDVPAPLPDPAFDLYNANGTFLTESNDWRTTSGADLVRATGLAPEDDREAALYISLAPGNYTAVLRGVDHSVGVGLVEIYNVGQ